MRRPSKLITRGGKVPERSASRWPFSLDNLGQGERRCDKKPCLALMFAASAVTAATADESCKDQARESKFTGETLKNFMTNCKDLATIVCDGQAIDQKVSDDAKDSFIKQCI
jgi:hypothetical protein